MGRLDTLINEGKSRFGAALEERGVVQLLTYASWKVALIDGAFPSIGLDQLLWRLNVNKPDYTGWPVWLNFPVRSRPYVLNGAKEALILKIASAYFNHIDLMQMDLGGRFYNYRALEDDITSSNNAPNPMISLDAGL